MGCVMDEIEYWQTVGQWEEFEEIEKEEKDDITISIDC